MSLKLCAANRGSKKSRFIIQKVKDVYEQEYNAIVSPNPDEFVYLADGDNIYSSYSLFYRTNHHKLFSEAYLERALPSNVLVEIGSAIALKPGFGRKIYQLLPYILYEKYYEYALLTLTAPVKNLFDRLGFKTVYLNDASKYKIKNYKSWGSFYSTNPKTYILDVSASMKYKDLNEITSTLGIHVESSGYQRFENKLISNE